MGRLRRTIAFVADECNGDLAASIRAYPVLSYRDIGLERGATDPKLIEHARNHGAIIITRNKRHFRRFMREAAERSTVDECFEGSGLITVPDDMPRFHFERLTRELNLNNVPIGWTDVLHLNLEVRLYHDAPAVVTLLPRCPKCVRDHGDCEACLTLGIADLMERSGVAV